MTIKIFRFIMASTLIGLYTVKLPAQENGHLHHVHMNVGSIEETTAFYQEYFGAVPVQYNDTVPALMTERAFLLMEEMPRDRIKNHLLTSLFHISWAGVDLPHEVIRLREQGVEFYTPLTPLWPGSYYVYLYGPDREVIEIFDTQRSHRFNHIHQVVEDPEESARWYLENVNPVLDRETWTDGAINLWLDDVAFSLIAIDGQYREQFTPRENTTGTLQPTEGSHLDHLAFSFRDLDAAYTRMQASGARIESPVTVDKKYGFRHFFVRAPSGLLVEFVEGSSWPEAAWE